MNHLEDDAFVVTFDAVVDQAAGNTRATADIAAAWTLSSYKDVDGTTVVTGPSSANLAVQIVEPSITTTITAPADNTQVSPGDDIAYTVRTGERGWRALSIAHETVTTVTVPVGLTPYAGGSPVADGGAIAGGTWNAGTRTIVWNEGDIDPGANATHAFTLRVDVPSTAGSRLRVDAVGTTTSHPGAAPLERSATTTPNAGYVSSANVNVELIGLDIAKTADRTTATIGEQALYTLDVTLRRDLTYYDVTVRDVLPAHLTWDSLVDATCVSGCASPSDLGATVLPQSGPTTGYFIGDVPQSASDRTVRIRYRAHVAGGAFEGNTLQNAANVYDNATNAIAGTPGAIPSPASFSQTAGPATHTITVHEPQSAIDKAVSGTATAGRITPGETATYTLTVRNTGLSPLHDVHVTDQPDVELAAVTPTDGAGAGDHAVVRRRQHDGVGHPGPDRAGRRRSCSATPRAWRASPGIAQNAAVDNTARITSAYGLAAATRAVNPGFTYRDLRAAPVVGEPAGRLPARRHRPDDGRRRQPGVGPGRGPAAVHVARRRHEHGHARRRP